MSILGNVVGAYSPMGKTFIITDENGNELTGVVVDQKQVFTATEDDVKIGKTFASEDGVGVGTDTKTYRVTKASRVVLPNKEYTIPLSYYDQYDYTKFQCIIAKFNSTAANSVYTNKISLEDNVYEVNSTEVLSQVTKNTETQSIDLNITNDTMDTYMIHYFVYKEEI